MNASFLLRVVAASVLIVPAFAVDEITKAKPPVQTRPPVFRAPGAEPSGSTNEAAPTAVAPPVGVYQQSTVAGRPPLVTREQAQAVTERFKRGYAKLGAPRIVLSINRELVDESSGLRVSERKEKRETYKADLTADPNARGANGQLGANVTVVGNVQTDGSIAVPGKGVSERVTTENTYRRDEPKPVALADKQTVRDVERLFGRPLRVGGAKLADQRVASQLLAGHSVQEYLPTVTGSNASREREALMKVADVVIEVLISSKSIVVPGVSGDATYAVPDIQATAVRLSDAQILGQASSTDIVGPDRAAGRIVRNYDVREITEATALALMEDMMQGVE